MRLCRHLSELSKITRPIFLTTGVFDGVHLGHYAVIRDTVQRARKANGEAVLLSFYPHPEKILRPAQAPPLLTTEQQDFELFATLGVDICVTLDFTEELSRREPRDFLDDLLKAMPSLRAIVVGPQWRFGHDQKGNFQLLQSWAAGHKLEAVEMPSVLLEGEVISSTAIRKLIAEGKIIEANARLGRPYQLVGRVVQGSGRGAQMGFPTANLEIENELMPAGGVYAARALLEGDVFAAAVNIGQRPTVSTTGEFVIEAHLLQFSGNLYGHHLRLDFLGRLRDERKFDNTQDLRAQVYQDALASFYLAHH